MIQSEIGSNDSLFNLHLMVLYSEVLVLPTFSIPSYDLAYSLNLRSSAYLDPSKEKVYVKLNSLVYILPS